LQNGTGYITDLGMTGPKDSVLGVKKEIIINRLKSNDMSKFELADGECILNGCIFDVDNSTGKTTRVERICI
jgi:calcineurin-like phosphoesterase